MVKEVAWIVAVLFSALLWYWVLIFLAGNWSVLGKIGAVFAGVFVLGSFVRWYDNRKRLHEEKRQAVDKTHRTLV
jgi:hypothetical protein